MVMDSTLTLLVMGLILYNGYVFGLRPWLIRPPLELRVDVQPPALSVGGPSTIHVLYAYHGPTTAHDVRIDVDLPASYELKSANPEEGFNREKTEWTVSELKPGARGEFVLQGSDWSPIGRQEPLSITATAKMDDAAGGTRPLTAVLEGWLETQTPLVDAHVLIPSTVVLNQPTSVTLTLTNTTGAILPELLIKPTLPAGWVTTEALPSLQKGPWIVSTLEKDTKATFTLTGHYETLPQSPSFFFSIELKNGGREVVSARADTTIIDPSLELIAAANVGSGMEAGDEIPVTINFSNRGEFALEDVTISLTPKGIYVDTTSITAEGASVGNGSVSWSPKELPILGQLVPNQHGELHMKLKTIKGVSLSDHSPLDDFSVVLQPQASFRLSVLPNVTVAWYGSSASVPVNTSLGITAEVQYYTRDGEQVGRGPFPPRVGRKTSYGLAVNASNTIHDLYESIVHIVLPPNVEWTNHASVTIGKPITYDKATRTITWTIGRLDNMIGPSPKNATAHMELALTPTVADTGKDVPLVTSIAATGVDGITKSARNATFAPLSTASTAYGAVDGKVKP